MNTLGFKLGAGTAVLALAAGGGVALASSGHGRSTQSPSAFATGPRAAHGPFGDAATYLGLTPQQLFTQLQSGKTLAQIANGTSGKSAAGLIDALVNAEKSEIGAAVSAGRIMQAQATQFESNLKQRITDRVNGTFKTGPRRDVFGPRHDLSGAVLTYLGLTADQLRTQLQSGKTLAQIANATSGKSASGLVDALVAAAKKDIAAAVSAGKLTQSQATQFESSLKQRITDEVNRMRPAGGWHGGPPPSPGANA